MNDEPAQVEEGGEGAAGGGGGGVVAQAEKHNVDQKYSWEMWIRNMLRNMDQLYNQEIHFKRGCDANIHTAGKYNETRS